MMLDLGSFGFKYAYVLILLPVLWTGLSIMPIKTNKPLDFSSLEVKSIKEVTTLSHNRTEIPALAHIYRPIMSPHSSGTPFIPSKK
jgi:hypothetical protein